MRRSLNSFPCSLRIVRRASPTSFVEHRLEWHVVEIAAAEFPPPIGGQHHAALGSSGLLSSMQCGSGRRSGGHCRSLLVRHPIYADLVLNQQAVVEPDADRRSAQTERCSHSGHAHAVRSVSVVRHSAVALLLISRSLNVNAEDSHA